MTTLEKVTLHFKQTLFSSAHACAEMTGLEPEQILAGMKQLIGSGRIRPVEHIDGLYQYVQRLEQKEKTRVAPEQKKLWWAINMPQNNPASFSAFSLAQIAGVDFEYVKTYLGQLRNKNLIRNIGRHRERMLYRVAPGAPAPDEPPAINIKNGKES